MTGVAAAVASVPTKSTFFRVLVVRLAFCAEGVLTIPEGATPAATPRRLTRRDTLTAFGDLAAPHQPQLRRRTAFRSDRAPVALVRRSNLAEIDCVSSWLLPFRRLLAPPRGFPSLLAEFVRRHDEHGVRRSVRHVDHSQVPTPPRFDRGRCVRRRDRRDPPSVAPGHPP